MRTLFIILLLLVFSVHTVHECKDCGRTFKYKMHFFGHCNKHNNLKFACNYCDKAYCYFGSLNNHVEEFHPGQKVGEIKLINAEQNVALDENKDLEKPKKRKRNYFVCKLDGQQFTQQKKFYNHIEENHLKK